MALLNDPDSLTDSALDDGSTNVFIDTTNLTIKLVPGQGGLVAADGVTEKAIYSFIKEEWTADPLTKNLAAFDFPFTPITDEFYELVNGWNWADATTRQSIRRGGWLVRDAFQLTYSSGSGTIPALTDTVTWSGGTGEVIDLVSGNNVAGVLTVSISTGRAPSTPSSLTSGGWSATLDSVSARVREHWAGTAIIDAEADDQIYYDLGVGAVNFTFTGNTAEAIQVISDPDGDGVYSDGFDRSSNVVVYNREQGQIFSSSSSTGIGESSLLAPKLFTFSLATGSDLNISVADIGIDADSNGTADVSPYSGMSITFYTTPQSRTIGASNFDFGIIIDGNNGTRQQIYEFVQWALRQTNDQDAGAGSLIGNVMPELVEFVGDTLKTLSASSNYQGGGTGVYIDNFIAADTNLLAFQDNTGTERVFPFVAAGNLNFSDTLVSDPSAVYFMYFTDGVTSGLEFGNSTAILVDNNGGSDITGSVSAASVAFDFDYDGNNQGSRTPGTDANVTVVALGLDTGQYIKATGTITRSNANSITLTAAVERNYENP